MALEAQKRPPRVLGELPGPDGFPPEFYRAHWKVIGPDLCRVVKHILRGDPLPQGLNHTHICLIPKCKQPSRITEFRPISLCNTVYKIATKVIANRLKGILDGIIDHAQGAFQSEKLLTIPCLLLSSFITSTPVGLTACIFYL